MNKVYEINKNDLTRNIYSSYYQLLYAKGKLDLAEKLDSVFRNFEAAAKIRYETGETNKLELLSAIGKKQEIQTIVEKTLTKKQFVFINA